LNRYIRAGIYIITIAGIFLFIFFKRDKLELVTEFTSFQFGLLIGISFFNLFFMALFFKYILSFFNIKLPFKEWFGLTVINSMYNHLLPARGGLAVRALFLKKKYGFSFSNYITLLSGSYIIYFAVSSFIATLCTGIYMVIKNENIMNLFWISGGIFIFTLMLIFYFLNLNVNKIKNKNKFIQHLITIISGLQYFKQKKKEVLILVLIHICLIITLTTRQFLIFNWLNINISYLAVFIIESLVFFTIIIAITPGNLGIKEGALGLGIMFFNIPFNEALMGAILDRMVIIITIFVLGVLFSGLILNNFKFTKTKEQK